MPVSGRSWPCWYALTAFQVAESNFFVSLTLSNFCALRTVAPVLPYSRAANEVFLTSDSVRGQADVRGVLVSVAYVPVNAMQGPRSIVPTLPVQNDVLPRAPFQLNEMCT